MICLVTMLCLLLGFPGQEQAPDEGLNERAVTLSRYMLNDYRIPRYQYAPLKALNLRHLQEVKQASRDCPSVTHPCTKGLDSLQRSYEFRLQQLITAQQYSAYRQNPPSRLHAQQGVHLDPRVYMRNQKIPLQVLAGQPAQKSGAQSEKPGLTKTQQKTGSHFNHLTPGKR